jgi:hypothetical protein
MSVAAFLNDVIPPVRLFLALLFTVGFTLLAVRLLHTNTLALAALDEPVEEPDAGDSTVTTTHFLTPPARDLAGRVLALTGFGFIFLFTFTFANFWSNGQAAMTAVQNEQWAYTKALASAEALPAGASRDSVVSALHSYADSVRTQEWPLMQVADLRAAAQIHTTASSQLAQVLLAASTSDAAKSPAVAPLQGGISDMISDGNTRIMQLPGPTAPSVLGMILILGISNLALTAAFQPTRIRPNLILMGTMATLTGLLFFLVVEASNVYSGGTMPIPAFAG